MRRGFGDLPTDTVLNTSGLPVGNYTSDAITMAALDMLPATGIQPVNLIDYANTTAPTSPVTWMLLAAGGIFLLALLVPGGRR